MEGLAMSARLWDIIAIGFLVVFLLWAMNDNRKESHNFGSCNFMHVCVVSLAKA
jgi:hypothetical protein